MTRVSPTLEGFRAAWHRPSLVLAEITWRWMVGGTAFALFAFWFIEYLRTLPVSNTELLLLRSRHPVLVARALSHILHGSLSRVVLSVLVAALALGVLWVIAGAIGRAATVRGLLEHVQSKFPETAEQVSASEQSPIRALLGLNSLRAAVILAASVGLAGASIIAGSVSSSAHPRKGLAFLVFLLIAGLISGAAWTLNWILSLAAIFAVRDGADTLGSLSSAVTLCRERARQVSAVTSWFELIHLVLLVGASTVFGLPLSFLTVVPGRVILVVLVLLSLIYSAIVDWFYLARLGGYVCIAELPAEAFAPVKLAPIVPPPVPAPPLPPTAPIETTIDRDEPILSDPGPLTTFAISM